MANNYQFQYGQPQQSQSQPFQSQQFFPPPQGNVYTISNSLEVANVPMSGGLSVALCLSEGLLYLKSMQNGNPMFMAYKITPYDNRENSNQNFLQNNSSTNQQQELLSALVEEFQKHREKIKALEQEINELKKGSGGKVNELI